MLCKNKSSQINVDKELTSSSLSNHSLQSLYYSAYDLEILTWNSDPPAPIGIAGIFVLLEDQALPHIARMKRDVALAPSS